MTRITVNYVDNIFVILSIIFSWDQYLLGQPLVPRQESNGLILGLIKTLFPPRKTYLSRLERRQKYKRGTRVNSGEDLPSGKNK
jgi:hypothetical protein